jgi:hypothetical protein
MQPKWKIKKSAIDTSIQGMEPRFWVENTARLFDQHFFLPNRGDSGEVFAALYMLLCGDVLRYNRDPYMRMFEVDLQAWLDEVNPPRTPDKPEPPKYKAKNKALKTPDAPEPKRQKLTLRRSPRSKPVDKAPDVRTTMDMHDKMMVDETSRNTVQGTMGYLDTTDCMLTLNFIQVCRNYFRSHAWFGQSMLEYMYNTATGCYVFPNCPAIDIVFPIKQVKTNGGAISYHPCLVSVKCWENIGRSDMDSALTRMRGYLEDRRTDDDKSTKALCLLLVIGTSSIPKELPKCQGSFPKEDTYISVVMPSSDKFGINQTIATMAGASHISELLASHSFAYAEKNESALRATATEAYHKLGRSLLKDKKEIWEDQIKKTTAAEYKRVGPEIG